MGEVRGGSGKGKKERREEGEQVAEEVVMHDTDKKCTEILPSDDIHSAASKEVFHLIQE